MSKAMQDCAIKCDDITIAEKQSINVNIFNTKAAKSKDNKSLAFCENGPANENAKRAKCQSRNVKADKGIADVCNVQSKGNIMASKKLNCVKEKESISSSERTKKYNAKEAKEKKNKEDTRSKSRGSGGNDIGSHKETVMPFARNKEQLPDQVYITVQFMDFCSMCINMT